MGEVLVPKKSVRFSVQPCITTGQQTIPSQAEEDEKEYSPGTGGGGPGGPKGGGS